MPFNMLDKKMSGLQEENSFYLSDLGKQQRSDSSPHVVGAFVATVGVSFFADFDHDMKKILSRFNPKIAAKTNVQRIAQKI
jgi:hypothetical protein